MKYVINNFVDAAPIEIEGYSHPTPACGALVSITQNIGSVSLNHSMRPEQARALAAFLMVAAGKAERLEAERDRAVEVAA